VHGHRVLEATTGHDGLELTRAERPDLILVDYHMPEMDGLAVVAALKSDTLTRAIPVRAGNLARTRRRVPAGHRGAGSAATHRAAEQSCGDRSLTDGRPKIVRLCQSGLGPIRACAASSREPSRTRREEIRKPVALAVL